MQRQKHLAAGQVDFSMSFAVSHFTALNRAAPCAARVITTVDDLAGQEVFVRKGSIYDESLVRLNAQLKTRGA